MTLKNKKILITAGPTWVAIDSVRVISNTATGQTGILLAKRLAKLGAKVTLVLGPVGQVKFSKRIRIISFRFFDQLKDIILKEISLAKYDAVIHSAAVSDYRPKKDYIRKVESGKKVWDLILKPTPKIINCIKKLDPSVFLVGFKFEPQVSKNLLFKRAKCLLKRAKLDLVIANTIKDNHYQAYFLTERNISKLCLNKNVLVRNLTLILKENI